MSRTASHQNLRRTRRFENLLPLKDDAQKDLDEALPALQTAVQRSRTFCVSICLNLSQDFVDFPARLAAHQCARSMFFNLKVACLNKLQTKHIQEALAKRCKK